MGCCYLAGIEEYKTKCDAYTQIMLNIIEKEGEDVFQEKVFFLREEHPELKTKYYHPIAGILRLQFF